MSARLDEEIKIHFNISSSVNDEICKYEVSVSNTYSSTEKKTVFVGNIFIGKNETSIDVDITDIARSYREVLPIENKDYSIITDPLKMYWFVKIYRNSGIITEWDEVNMYYRDINTPRNFYAVPYYIRQSSDLIPHIPYKLTDNMVFGIAFNSVLNESTEDIYYSGFDVEKFTVDIETNKYNGIIRKLSTLFDEVSTKEYEYKVVVDNAKKLQTVKVIQDDNQHTAYIVKYGDEVRFIDDLGDCEAYIDVNGYWYFNQGGTSMWFKGTMDFEGDVDVNNHYADIGTTEMECRDWYNWCLFNNQIGFIYSMTYLPTVTETNNFLKENVNTNYWYDEVLAMAESLDIVVTEHSENKVEEWYLWNGQSGALKETYAIVDICPSKYYLIWYDRWLGIQAQPFDGKSVYSENITRGEVVNYNGYRRNVYWGVQGKWELNTNWLTDNEYKGFESMWVSPYVYMYDSENDVLHNVILTNNTYTEKKWENEQKLYNLTINVEINNKQNIFN